MSQTVLISFIVIIAIVIIAAVILAIYFGLKTGDNNTSTGNDAPVISVNRVLDNGDHFNDLRNIHVPDDNNLYDPTQQKPCNFNGYIDIASAPSTNPDINHMPMIPFDLLTSPMSTELSYDDVIEPINMMNPNDIKIKEYHCLDICNYDDNDLLIVNNDHTLSYKTRNDVEKIETLTKFKNIVSFAGHIHLVSIDGKLYMMRSFDDIVEVEGVSVPMQRIKYICSTYDENYLWVQDDNKGTLYDDEMKVIETVDIKLSDKYRIYGKTKDDYKDINPTINKSAVMDYNGTVYKNNNAHLMRLINWKPVILL